MSILLLPAGISQLHMLAAALDLDDATIGKSIVSLCYYFDKDMDRAMREAGHALSMPYLGNMAPIQFKGFDNLDINIFDKAWTYLRPRSYLLKLAMRAGLPPNISPSEIAYSIRLGITDEAIIDAALLPKAHVRVMDGVVSREVKRQLEGRNWRGFRTEHWNLPIDQAIFTPEFLQTDAARIGNPVVIPDRKMEIVASRLRNMPLYLECIEYLSGVSNAAIIFSQQIARLNYCSIEEETRFYLRCIELAHEEGADQVIFKPHPRDTIEKIEQISKCLSRKNVLIMPPEFRPIPFEIFPENLLEKISLGISCNSSALLSCGRHATAISASGMGFTDQSRQLIADFCKTHGTKHRLV